MSLLQIPPEVNPGWSCYPGRVRDFIVSGTHADDNPPHLVARRACVPRGRREDGATAPPRIEGPGRRPSADRGGSPLCGAGSRVPRPCAGTCGCLPAGRPDWSLRNDGLASRTSPMNPVLEPSRRGPRLAFARRRSIHQALRRFVLSIWYATARGRQTRIRYAITAADRTNARLGPESVDLVFSARERDLPAGSSPATSGVTPDCGRHGVRGLYVCPSCRLHWA
jgi:hypothetical protein